MNLNPLDAIILDYLAHHCSKSSPSEEFFMMKQKIETLKSNLGHDWELFKNDLRVEDTFGLIYLLLLKELIPFRSKLEYPDDSLFTEKYLQGFHMKESCSGECTKTTCELIKYLVVDVYENDKKLIERQSSFMNGDGYYVLVMHWLAYFGQLSLVKYLMRECGFNARVESQIDWVNDWSINQAFVEKHFDLVREMCNEDYSFFLEDKCDDFPAGCLYTTMELVRGDETEHWNFIVEEYLRGKLSNEILSEAFNTWERESTDFLRAKQDISMKKRPIRNCNQFRDVYFEFIT